MSGGNPGSQTRTSSSRQPRRRASVPATDLTLAPLIVLTLIAAALIAAGLSGFRHRDLATD